MRPSPSLFATLPPISVTAAEACSRCSLVLAAPWWVDDPDMKLGQDFKPTYAQCPPRSAARSYLVVATKKNPKQSEKRQAARACPIRLVGAARRLHAVRPAHAAILSRHLGASGPTAPPFLSGLTRAKPDFLSSAYGN